MDRHAHPSGAPSATLGRQGTLGGEGGQHGVGRPGEGGDEAVALALLDGPDAGVSPDGFVQQLEWRAMAAAMASGSASHRTVDALDVGEQEGDGALGHDGTARQQVGHGPLIQDARSPGHAPSCVTKWAIGARRTSPAGEIVGEGESRA